MRFRKKQRMVLVLVALLLLGGASALILTAFSDNITFFVSPTRLQAMEVDENQRLRIGGLVVDGSVKQQPDGSVLFDVTDVNHAVTIRFAGVLPDLFREGQGIIAQGYLGGDGVFIADEVLAKHDENYMPKELADELKAQGYWKHNEDGETAK
ncbi:MAG: cytochrome c maturation protein CcmE [Geminicoccaceae bacterium]|nr:cytochrome c maturation protein CcmE [Geminicoccaceae bacterium]